jgi:hypothetical protein
MLVTLIQFASSGDGVPSWYNSSQPAVGSPNHLRSATCIHGLMSSGKRKQSCLMSSRGFDHTSCKILGSKMIAIKSQIQAKTVAKTSKKFLSTNIYTFFWCRGSNCESATGTLQDSASQLPQ